MAKQRISVASTVVNMAGDEENRVNYLRTTVLGGVLSKKKQSLGEHINTSYITGPGITFRLFAKWVRSNKSPRQNYNQKIQFKSTSIGVTGTNNFNNIASQIQVSGDETVELFTATVDQGLYTYWADQWMLENYPELIRSNWSVTYEQGTNTITVKFADGSTQSFVPVSNNQQLMYLFAKYRTKKTTIGGTSINGPVVFLAPNESYPSTTGMTLDSSVVGSGTYNLIQSSQTVSTYSDNRTPITGAVSTITSSFAYSTFTEVYSKEVTENTTSGLTKFTKRLTLIRAVGVPTVNTSVTVSTTTIAGGVVRTDTTTVNQQVFAYARSYQESKITLSKTTYSSTKLFIYQYGTGNAVLDSIIGSDDSLESYLPFIPVYVDNKFLDKTFLPEIYSATKTAYRRVSRNQNINKIRSKLKDHESLPDIDYTFCVFGVSLNVVEMACREYLYLFFDRMRMQYASSTTTFEQWLIDFDLARDSQLAYEEWRNAQGNTENPLNGVPAPDILPYPKLPEVRIRTYSENAVLGYDNSIMWSGITKETLSGLGKPTAKKDDAWFEIGPVVSRAELVPQEHWEGSTVLVNGDSHDITTTYLYFQESKEVCYKLTILNLKHRNIVYQGHFVETTATAALNDDSESPFIVPLHENIFKEMRLVRSTQMTAACSFLVFNSYVVTKIKWYQRGFFRIIITIAAIALSVYSGGTSLGAAGGILGTNAYVGSMLSLTGLAGAIAGAVLNATASMILFSVISTAATKMLGPELGAILGAVGMIFLQNPGLLDSFGSSLSTGFSELLRADNMLKLTDAVGKGMQAANAGLAKQMQKDIDAYNTEAGNIRNQFYEQFGTGTGVSITPYLLNQAQESVITIESLDSFLSRTLLSGTDVADLSQSLISDFASLTTDPVLTK